jgi:hypothetical protein
MDFSSSRDILSPCGISQTAYGEEECWTSSADGRLWWHRQAPVRVGRTRCRHTTTLHRCLPSDLAWRVSATLVRRTYHVLTVD